MTTVTGSSVTSFFDETPVGPPPVEPEEGWGLEADERPQIVGLRVHTLTEIRRRKDLVVPWVVEDILVESGITLLAGSEGEGKSLVGLELASCVASGERFAWAKVKKPGPVLYMDAENGLHEMGRRCNLLRVKGDVQIAEAESFDMTARWGEFSRLIHATKPAMVVLDSLASLWPQMDENDKKSAQQALQPLRNLGLQTGSSFLLLHHLSKGTGTYRGSGAIGAVVQIVINMAQPGDDESIRKLRWKKSRVANKLPPQTLKLTAGQDSLTIGRFG